MVLEQIEDEADNRTEDFASAVVQARGGVLQTEGRDACLRIGDEVQIIGRSPHAALVVDHELVSKLHLEVQATPDGVRLKDLDSRNGSFLEGPGGAMRFTEIFLAHPATVRLGPSRRLCFAPELLPPVLRPEPSRFGGLLGSSPAMLELFATLHRYADGEMSVLISGETGTGKERVARAIHHASARRGKPFVARNCAELAAYSFEDDLFGHVKGAFTGADRERAGAFVEADGGTLFLDEVAELGLPQQAKLLRALQEKESRPLGSDKARRVDVRCLFATNADLPEAVEKGTFREDLYFRVAQARVEVPSLRERAADMPLLVHDILRELNRPDVAVDDEALGELAGHGWRGNVRELSNVIACALSGLRGDAVLSKSDVLAALPSTRAAGRLQGTYQAVKEDLDRAYYTRLFTEHSGNVTQMAHAADVDRKTVAKVLRSLGLHERSEQRATPSATSKAALLMPIPLDSWRRRR